MEQLCKKILGDTDTDKGMVGKCIDLHKLVYHRYV